MRVIADADGVASIVAPKSLAGVGMGSCVSWFGTLRFRPPGVRACEYVVPGELLLCSTCEVDTVSLEVWRVFRGVASATLALASSCVAVRSYGEDGDG